MLVGVVGAILLATGLCFNLLYAPTNGQDFGEWWFPAGQRFAAGQNLYVISGDIRKLDEARAGTVAPLRIPADAYPPLHAALVAPVVPLGRFAGQYVFLAASLALFAWGLWKLLEVATEWSPSSRLFALGVAMWASSVRWSSGQYQFSLMAMGLVCLAMYGALTNKKGTTIWSIALCVKFTMLMPVVAVLLFRRQLTTLIAGGLLAGALNAACLLWMGPVDSFLGWRLSMANYVVVNGLNYPSLSTFIARLHGDAARAVEPVGIQLFKGFDYYYYPEHTHWVLLLTAWTADLKTAQLIGMALVAAAGAFLAVIGWRMRDRKDDVELLKRWFVVGSAFGLVAMTHLKYDLLALVPVTFLTISLIPTRNLLADKLLAVASFAAAFLLAARIATIWIFSVAVPLGAYWLVPFYVYIATAIFLLSVWGLLKVAPTPTAVR